MARHEYGDKIAEDLGIPTEEVSCPGCGHRYGRFNRKVCKNCEGCSKCCRCKTPELISAEEMIAKIMKGAS